MNEALFDTYAKFPASLVSGLGFPPQQLTFLSEVGLPDWCAPNMHLGEVGEDYEVLPVLEIGNKRYVGIGEDRYNNVIAVDLESFEVWTVSNNTALAYVARNVMELSTAIHMFQSCINRAVDSNENAYIERNIASEFMEEFLTWARKTNPFIIYPETFWGGVLQWLNVLNPSFKRDWLKPAP